MGGEHLGATEEEGTIPAEAAEYSSEEVAPHSLGSLAHDY